MLSTFLLTIQYNPSSLLNDPQQLNLYAYARGNPIKYNDPSGNAAVPQKKNPISVQSVLKKLFAPLVTKLTQSKTSSNSKSSAAFIGPMKTNVTSPVINKTQNYNEKLAGVVEKQVGKVYLEDANSNGPDVFDCSGIIIYAIRQTVNPKFGDHSADDLYRNYTTNDSVSTPERGTINYYSYGVGPGEIPRINHMSTNVGNNNIINPGSESTGIRLMLRSVLEDYTITKRNGTSYLKQLNWDKIIKENNE